MKTSCSFSISALHTFCGESLANLLLAYPSKTISIQQDKQGPAYSFISEWRISGNGSYHDGKVDISVFLLFLKSLKSLEMFSIEISSIEFGTNLFMFSVKTGGIRDKFLSFQLPVSETNFVDELHSIATNITDHRTVAA